MSVEQGRRSNGRRTSLRWYRIAGPAFVIGSVIGLTGCLPGLKVRAVRNDLPARYPAQTADSSGASRPWQELYTDPHLRSLIDSALANNQELNILPIAEEQAFPEPLPDLMVAARASWELDVWGRLRNAKKAALMRYLGTVEGRNFAVTRLVAEIANSYFELLALDQQLEILRNNIGIQQDALEIVRMEKQAAKVTELAVRRFEAEVLRNRSLLFEVQQRIVETENRINFLVGRYPRPIQRDPAVFTALLPGVLQAGVPSELLRQRPDVRRAELELEAARLDVRSARAAFYPSLRLTAGAGLNAFNGSYLLETPAALLYNAAGDLVAPLVNRNAIKAAYFGANARQQQAMFDYERTVLNAYVEVVNQLSNMDNLAKSYALREEQVAALSSSITISNNLFRSARADYMEVLLTQRDALESKVELVELRQRQLGAQVAMYQALGGGWR